MSKKAVDAVPTDDLVVLKRAPILNFNLKPIADEIRDIIANLDIENIKATEKNKAKLKKIRADLNKKHKAYEESRLEIRRIVLDPYDIFNKEYQETISIELKDADKLLKEKIDTITKEQKKEIEDYASNYFDKVYKAEKVGFIKFNDIKVSYKNKKQVRESIDKHFDDIKSDLKLISLQEDSELIEAEYRMNGYKVKEAMLTIQERKALAEKIANESKPTVDNMEEPEEEEEFEEELVFEEQVEAEEPEPEELYETSLTLKCTENQLGLLLDFLDENDFEYSI